MTYSSIEGKKQQILVPILIGTEFDLTRFDFSFKDITIYEVQSEGFKKYIDSLKSDQNNDDFSLAMQVREGGHNEFDRKFALVKNNPRHEFKYEDILNVWKLLLIIFPSDLQIIQVINLINKEGIIQVSHLSYWDKRMETCYPGDLLCSVEETIPEINNFAQKYFEHLNNKKYIGIAISNYLASFSASHLEFKYLSLCIALEGIIHGKAEVTNRLRRTLAVLCGDNVESSEIIYSNVSKIYDIRSAIAHGEDYNPDTVIEYLKPLRALVSRVIIELLVHGFQNNQDLNEAVVRVGFGDRNRIYSERKRLKTNIKNTEVPLEWKKYVLNASTIIDSSSRKLH